MTQRKHMELYVRIESFTLYVIEREWQTHREKETERVNKFESNKTFWVDDFDWDTQWEKLKKRTARKSISLLPDLPSSGHHIFNRNIKLIAKTFSYLFVEANGRVKDATFNHILDEMLSLFMISLRGKSLNWPNSSECFCCKLPVSRTRFNAAHFRKSCTLNLSFCF